MAPYLLRSGPSLGERALTCAVVTGAEDLLALGPAWNDLYARCATATPFQSHAWVTSWWHHYHGRHRLAVVVLRDSDRLLAVLPMMRSLRWGCRVLRPLADSLSDYTDVLLDDEDRELLAPAANQALLQLPGWDVADFPEVRPGGAVEHLCAGWTRHRRVMDASTCLYVPARPLADVAAAGGRTAGNLRRALRRIDELGVKITQVPPERVPAAMRELVSLHALQWAGRPINQEHLRPRFERHLAQAVTDLVAGGQATLSEFHVGERLVAADLSLIGTDFLGGYLYGADPWLRSKVDIFAMILQRGLRETVERELPQMSMLRGGEAHKAKWGAEAFANRRVIMGRTHRASLYIAMADARAHAARTAKRHLSRSAAPTVAGQVLPFPYTPGTK